MKKIIIDKLQDSTGEIDYMIRGKGLTQKSIEHAYKSRFHMDPMQLYKHLYNGNVYVFNLINGKPCFFMNKS